MLIPALLGRRREKSGLISPRGDCGSARGRWQTRRRAPAALPALPPSPRPQPLEIGQERGTQTWHRWCLFKATCSTSVLGLTSPAATVWDSAGRELGH